MMSVPKYKSNLIKTVWALKIGDDIKSLESGAVQVSLADPGFEPITLRSEVVAKYTRQHHCMLKPGDYYVVYEGGPQLISPAKEFEEGHTRV